MANILIVHEENSFRDTLVFLLKQERFQVDSFDDFQESSVSEMNCVYDIAIIDLKFGELDTIEFIQNLKSRSPFTEIILISTIHASGSSTQFKRCGVFDFVDRPFEVEEILFKIERALERRKLSSKIEFLENELKEISRLEDSASIFHESIKSLLQTDATALKQGVLISGEKGTGKRVIAETIHQNSHMKSKPFLVIDCSEVKESDLEKKLFGDAGNDDNIQDSDKAQSGTLVLENIEKLSLSVQEKIASGSLSGVLLMALTGYDLKSELKAGRFHKGLYEMLSHNPLFVPPLKKRRKDIEVHIEYSMEKLRSRFGKPDLTLSDRALGLLMSYDWPGNVIELEKVMETAFMKCPNGMILPDDLPPEIFGSQKHSLKNAVMRDLTLAELEKEYILEVLEQVSWNKTRAAEKLGITRATLLNKLKLYKNQEEAEVA